MGISLSQQGEVRGSEYLPRGCPLKDRGSSLWSAQDFEGLSVPVGV